MQKGNKVSLDKLDRKPCFSVPEGYFNSLPGLIRGRVTQTSPPLGLSSAWLRFSLGLSALALVLVVSYLLYRPAAPDPAQVLATVPVGEIVDYASTEFDVSHQEWIEAAALTGIEPDYSPAQYPEADLEFLLDALEVYTLEEIF